MITKIYCYRISCPQSLQVHDYITPIHYCHFLFLSFFLFFLYRKAFTGRDSYRHHHSGSFVGFGNFDRDDRKKKVVQRNLGLRKLGQQLRDIFQCFEWHDTNKRKEIKKSTKSLLRSDYEWHMSLAYRVSI